MLKFIDGFDQYQAQAGSVLLGSLTAAGYVVSQGLAMTAGRHASTFALEMQVSAGAAGASWSKRTNGTKHDLLSVATNHLGRWLAVGEGGAATMSVDTINWVPMIVGVTADLRSVFFAAGQWVIVGDAGTILVSTNDGGTWTQKTCPIPAANLYGVSYASGRWTAVGVNAAAGVIIYSTDSGDSWSFVATNAGVAGNLCVAYGNGYWLVGGLGGQLLRSPDGVTWDVRSYGSAQPIYDLAYGEGKWIAGALRTIRQSTNDGTTWVEAAIDLGAVNTNIRTVEFIAGMWLAGGAYGYIGTSDDAITWTTRTLPGVFNTTVNSIGASSGTDGALVAVGDIVGTGSAAIALIYASLAPPTTLQRVFNSTANRVVIGFAHRASARGRIMSVAGLFDMDWPGPIEILGVQSTAVPIRNAWYYYELVIDKAAKTVSLFINNTVDVVVPLPTTVTSMVDWTITWQAENGAIARIDDMYFLDSATTGGAALVNRLQPIRIPLRLPTSDVNVEWESSAAIPHWSLVGVLPPSASSYIYSGEGGAEDLFNSGVALPAGAGAVLAVGLVALAKKSDLDNRQLGLVVGSGGTQSEIIDTVLSINSEYSFAIFEKAPGNVAWDASNILTTPFGVVVRP
jgi:photosystem II stability/assembly factor-like uncharacterized protein